jgi:hypothetical protein
MSIGLCLSMASYSQNIKLVTKKGKEVMTRINAATNEELYTSQGRFPYSQIASVSFEAKNAEDQAAYDRLAAAGVKVTYSFIQEPETAQPSPKEDAHDNPGDRTRDFSLGLRIGLNFSTEKVENASSTYQLDSRVGFLLGLYSKFRINNKISLQPELFYSSLGANYSDPVYSKTSWVVATNYLSLPILLRYRISDNFHLLAGPQLSIFLNGSSTFPYPGYENVDATRTDLAGVLGFEFDFGSFNAGARYCYGFSNIEPNPTHDLKVSNMALQLVAGYRLKFR